jgi:hypothetical protein
MNENSKRGFYAGIFKFLKKWNVMAKIISLTQIQIKHYKMTRKMTLEDIIASKDLDRLRARHSALFHLIANGKGSAIELNELRTIVQRLYDLGEPFYY